ncbi:MAG TPA: peptide deformylase [Salinivirga sp.]|uniref:peptide deformylase n=1 Tax=Salinivirga sp. TaxID=1970192 RepID=UPI002B46DF96|nr:peptide deformylase [Salinivirga sp.]HKK57836.1 peptide deformylase [Salinivirga sp.]
MIYPVTIIGHPTLRKRAEEVDQNYPDLEKIIDNMFETMYESDGVGLAAPQINKSIRIIVIDGAPMAEDDPDLKDFKKVLINPEMVDEWGEEKLFNEGCLSIPNIREDVNRPSEIKLKYYDRDFNLKEEEFKGTQARIIQHEYDHLEGILFTDRISPLRKKILKSKLLGLSKGKFKVSYRTVLGKK